MELFLVSQHTYTKKDKTEGVKSIFETENGQIVTSYSLPVYPSLVPSLPKVTVIVKPWINEKGQMVQLITGIDLSKSETGLR
jgi:hypothetical protein